MQPQEKTFFTSKNHVSIPAGHDRLPIEVTVVGKFPSGAGKAFLDSAFKQQAKHPEFIEEYNEPSALIGKPNFPESSLSTNNPSSDPTAIYSFGIDTRDLVFHRHVGHRVIIGVSGEKGCILRFSVCTEEEAKASPTSFLKQMYVITIAANRMFALRFNGTIYHQFSPVDPSEKAYFAVSVHTNEATGLEGELLEKVLTRQGNIPLLTEPAPQEVLKLLSHPNAYKDALFIDLDGVD
jgi:hypothetical protein